MPRNWHRGPGRRDLECADCQTTFPVGGDCACPPKPAPIRAVDRVPRIHPPMDDAGMSADEIRARFAALIVESDHAASSLVKAKNPREVGRWQSVVKLIEYRRKLLASAYESARDREQVNETDRLEKLVANMRPPVPSRRKMRKSDVDALLRPRPEVKPEEN